MRILYFVCIHLYIMEVLHATRIIITSKQISDFLFQVATNVLI